MEFHSKKSLINTYLVTIIDYQQLYLTFINLLLEIVLVPEICYGRRKQNVEPISLVQWVNSLARDIKAGQSSVYKINKNKNENYLYVQCKPVLRAKYND